MGLIELNQELAAAKGEEYAARKRLDLYVVGSRSHQHASKQLMGLREYRVKLEDAVLKAREAADKADLEAQADKEEAADE